MQPYLAIKAFQVQGYLLQNVYTFLLLKVNDDSLTKISQNIQKVSTHLTIQNTKEESSGKECKPQEIVLTCKFMDIGDKVT